MEGQVDERNLRYNELGPNLGLDGTDGWSFWTAPFKFEDGLIDDSLPEDQSDQFGVELPLPGGTRYIQFRIFFDSSQHSGASFDFIEFEYEAPLVEGGVLAEIFPPQVPLGEETSFRYVMRPFFEEATIGGFNRVEIDVPDVNSRIDTLRYDGQLWEELLDQPQTLNTEDPLLELTPGRLAPAVGTTDSVGQFVQTVVVDPTTGSTKLLLKLPTMRPEHFRFGENLEIVFTSTLFRGSKQFNSVVWNDLTSSRDTSIPQPIVGGDATPEISMDNLLVVVENINTGRDQVRLATDTFTPNNDGINDELKIFFDLFLVLDQVNIKVDILDLSGRPVHRLASSSHTAGTVELSWDGRDAQGTTVAPGIYFYRLKVESDDSSTEKIGTFSLVY